MATTTIHNSNNASKTVIYNNNKIEVGLKSFFGKQTVVYNDIAVPAKELFGGAIVFIAVENNKYVQYDVMIKLRWHCLGFYTEIKRQGQLIFSDK